MTAGVQGLATTRTIRRYTDEPIGEADLAQILWHANVGPQRQQPAAGALPGAA